MITHRHFEDADAPHVPPHIRDGIIGYINHGRPIGSFLTRVFCNDLMGAAQHADPDNFAALGSIAKWVAWYAPDACYGSDTAMIAWRSRGGLAGENASADVLCDLCNAGFDADSTDTGGFLFESKAVCPTCAPVFEENAKRYGETHLIRDRAQEGETFRNAVLRWRGQGEGAFVIVMRGGVL